MELQSDHCHLTIWAIVATNHNPFKTIIWNKGTATCGVEGIFWLLLLNKWRQLYTNLLYLIDFYRWAKLFCLQNRKTIEFFTSCHWFQDLQKVSVFLILLWFPSQEKKLKMPYRYVFDIVICWMISASKVISVLTHLVT